MAQYVIYKDAQGLIMAVYGACDTDSPPVGSTRTVQTGGATPIINPAYAPIQNAPTPSLEDRVAALEAIPTIATALASAQTAAPAASKATSGSV